MDKGTKQILLIAALIGAAGYVLYRQLGSAGRALTNAGEAVGSGLFDLFHKDQVGEMLFYTVKFPDGAQHAVPSRSVDAQGIFKRAGVEYRLLIDRRVTSGVNKVAVPT